MAIVNTKLDSGYETRFTETGNSIMLTGNELVASLDFSGAVATVVPEMLLAGLWTPIAANITADQPLATFAGPLVRARQMRFNCTAYTSGTVTINWSV